MTPESEEFLELVKALRELGATDVTVGAFSASFGTPQKAVVAPMPRRIEPPSDDDTPEARQAFRSEVQKKLVKRNG
jgi:hypothetical protein